MNTISGIILQKQQHRGSMLRLICTICCLCSLVACSGKNLSPSTASSTLSSQPIRDIRVIPQDLNVFAAKIGAKQPLISPAQQTLLDARCNRIIFGPWDMSKPSIKKREITALFRNPRGYKINGQRWSKEEWNNMLANAHLATYPNMLRHAITIRHANLRELPTSDTRFSEPTRNVRENPFDYFQYSSLPQGTPVFVTHVSRDRQWRYVETPIAGGWVRSDELGWVDDAFISRYTTGSYAAVIKDKVLLRNGDSVAGRTYIGMFFPIIRTSQAGLTVLAPVAGAGGMAKLVEVTLAPNEAVRKPLPLTPSNMALIGNAMMGQPYGWGGMLEERDCSATTRDLFIPFGLWLPRNSVAQARSGVRQDVRGLEREHKKALLLRNGQPFRTLVWLPGHITLYVGNYQGQPVIYHNMWGVRVVEKGDDNARHVVGRCAITTLEPGKELPNRYKDRILLDSVGAYTTLGDQ